MKFVTLSRRVSSARSLVLAPLVSVAMFGAIDANANTAPVVTGMPTATATVGQPYSYTIQATDADGDKLSFDLWHAPSWMKIVDGKLVGTPDKAGTWSDIEIFAYDGIAWTPLQPYFTVTAKAAANSGSNAGSTANRAPVIKGKPAATAAVGQPYSYALEVSDADGDAISYKTIRLPSWLKIVNNTLVGTPTTVGTFENIKIFALDGKTQSPLAPFTISVIAKGNAPTITGTPLKVVQAGSSYTFKPVAKATTGADLAFQIANKPSWATFSTATGALTGTPAAAQAGTYPGIAITVSDGKTTSALPSFSIEVKNPVAVNGNATLSWTAPTKNTDGTNLNNLAGYRVYYGTNASQLNQVVDITDPSATNYAVRSLSKNTFYFAVKSYTSNGSESAMSTVVSKTIL